MILDLLYLSYNRLKFTEVTFGLLLANTDWEHVSKVFLFDDNSYDGTKEFLDEARQDIPVENQLIVSCRRSPVEVMNDYCGNGRVSDLFCKLDNDIAVPPGWLDAMVGVMQRNPELELLGMEAGFPGIVEKTPSEYTYTEWSHIGGVGLMRADAFRRRKRIPNRGRFGFQEFQTKWDLKLGWITPELMVPQLDRIPLEPWCSLSESYIEAGWQRRWPRYDDRFCSHYYDWFTSVDG